MVILSKGDPQLWDKIKNLDLDRSVFVIPTDTVYGLSSLSSYEQLSHRIADLKGSAQSFIMLAQSVEQAAEIVSFGPHDRLVRAHWPGPVSFIFSLPHSNSTVALRVPSDPFLSRFLGLLGGLVVSTSCNRHGQAVVTNIDQAKALFHDDVDVYIDGGECTDLRPSTLVDLTQDNPKILRTGRGFLTLNV